MGNLNCTSEQGSRRRGMAKNEPPVDEYRAAEAEKGHQEGDLDRSQNQGSSDERTKGNLVRSLTFCIFNL